MQHLTIIFRAVVRPGCFQGSKPSYTDIFTLSGPSKFNLRLDFFGSSTEQESSPSQPRTSSYREAPTLAFTKTEQGSPFSFKMWLMVVMPVPTIYIIAYWLEHTRSETSGFSTILSLCPFSHDSDLPTRL